MRPSFWIKTVAAIGISVGVICFTLISSHSEEKMDPPSPTATGAEVAGLKPDALAAVQKIERLLASPSTQVETDPPRWKDLDDFHQLLLKSLALDPIPGSSVEEAGSQAMTRKLDGQLAKLIASPAVAQLGAQDEFQDYASTCQNIIELRKHRLYREARKIVRNGKLDQLYQAVVDQIQKNGSDPRHLRFSIRIPVDLERELRASINQLKKSAQATAGNATAPHAQSRAAPVHSSPAAAFVLANLLWLLASVIAFVTGRNVGRRSGPEAPIRGGGPSIPAGPGNRPVAAVRVRDPAGALNYSDWMRRYELALSAKKNNDAKDQEFLKRLNQFSWNFSQFFILYHLEPPASNVERFRKEMQTQSDALKELIGLAREAIARGDRSYREILENLLELCDSVEKPGAEKKQPIAAA